MVVMIWLNVANERMQRLQEFPKGKCGYAYGYSATFEYTVDGKVLNGNCECESRAWVRIGDRYPAAYDLSMPEKVQLIVDSAMRK